MSFFRILIFMFFLTFSGFSYSDNHETQKEEVLNKVKEIAKGELTIVGIPDEFF